MQGSADKAESSVGTPSIASFLGLIQTSWSLLVVVVITEEVVCSIADVEGMAVKRGGEPTMGSGTSPLEFGMASSSPSLSFSDAEPVLELVSISSIFFARSDDYDFVANGLLRY